MQATDLKPSRLISTQHKLTDLLKARQQGQTALVVYAGDAHIVSPLTDDTETIIAMVPALSPLIMPALGSRVTAGIELANQAFKNGGINKGRILLITDGIENKDIKTINEQLNSAGHQLSILVVGTADGGPIPIPEQGFLRDKDEIVIAQTDMPRLQQLAQITGAPIARLSLNDSDINSLLPNKAFDLNKTTHQVEREMDQWREEGPWLILLILPFAALAFRRGWLLSLVFVVLIQPAPVEAAAWSELSSNLWQTADQQAAKAFKEKDYETASGLFTSPGWQGSTAYRKGDFKAATKYFSQLDSASAHYNRGNALAQMGQFEDALKAYDEALKREPDLADAKANKKVIEELAKQQQQSSSQNKNQQQQSSRNQQPQDQQSQGQDQESQSQNQQQSSEDNQSEQQQKVSDQAEPEPETESASEQAAKEAEQQQAQSETEQSDTQQNEQAINQAQQLTEEEQQAMEQWLRRIPDDPSVLLKRKFNYQYQQNRQNNQFVPQQENEAIW